MVLRELSLSYLYSKVLTLFASKPQCRYGPHNPAIDVGCANCGFIPNYRSQVQTSEEPQSIAGFTGQFRLDSHPVPSMALSVPSNNSECDYFSPVSESFDLEHFPATVINNLANHF